MERNHKNEPRLTNIMKIKPKKSKPKVNLRKTKSMRNFGKKVTMLAI